MSESIVPEINMTSVSTNAPFIRNVKDLLTKITLVLKCAAKEGQDVSDIINDVSFYSRALTMEFSKLQPELRKEEFRDLYINHYEGWTSLPQDDLWLKDGDLVLTSVFKNGTKTKNVCIELGRIFSIVDSLESDSILKGEKVRKLMSNFKPSILVYLMRAFSLVVLPDEREEVMTLLGHYESLLHIERFDVLRALGEKNDDEADQLINGLKGFATDIGFDDKMFNGLSGDHARSAMDQVKKLCNNSGIDVRKILGSVGSGNQEDLMNSLSSLGPALEGMNLGNLFGQQTQSKSEEEPAPIHDS